MIENENTELVSCHVQINYLVASLLDFFRMPSNESRYLHAAKIANRQISLYLGIKRNLERRLQFYASALKNNITPQSIRAFANECYLTALSLGVHKNLPKDELSPMSLNKQTKQNLSWALASGLSESGAVNKTALMLVKQKKKLDQATKVKNLAEAHPLKDVFRACNMLKKPLCKEDVKQQFLNLGRHHNKEGKDASLLLSLLKKAQAFSSTKLHDLLGDELFYLCRPVGFIDNLGTILLIDVPTNAHLHALTYRKLEIKRALQKDLAFQKIQSMRFRVINTSL